MLECPISATMARLKDVCRLNARSTVLTLLLQMPICCIVFTVLDFESCKQAARILSGFEVESRLDPTFPMLLCNDEKQVTAGIVTKSLKPLSHPHHPFVPYSAYRKSYRTFHVVGITSALLRAYENPVHRCEWRSKNVSKSAIETTANITYLSFDEHNSDYVPITVMCTFDEDAGKDGLGGVLRLNISNGLFSEGRKATKIIDVMVENRGEASVVESKPPYKYAFCGSPMHGTIRSQWVLSWLVYHHYLLRGEAHFMFYNVGGLREKHRYLFQRFIQAKLLTITDTLDEDLYPSWWHNQVLFINDCLHRSRFLAEWVFFIDFDEFLHVPPPHTMQSLLAENSDKPWVTFGSLPTSVRLCKVSSAPGDWTIEQMQWRNKVPQCTNLDENPWLCFSSHGRRKYVVNPRNATSGGVHKVAFPHHGGVNLNAAVARLYHYHGALSHWRRLCEDMVNVSLPLKDLSRIPYYNEKVQDDAISDTFREAKAFAASLIPPGA